MTQQAFSPKELKGRHVLMVLCGFFGVMFVVNGIFVYFAVATFSGGDTSDPYRKGLHYNETLTADERQAERGWRTDIAYDDKTRPARAELPRQEGGADHRTHASTASSAGRRPTRRTGMSP